MVSTASGALQHLHVPRSWGEFKKQVYGHMYLYLHEFVLCDKSHAQHKQTPVKLEYTCSHSVHGSSVHSSDTKACLDVSQCGYLPSSSKRGPLLAPRFECKVLAQSMWRFGPETAGINLVLGPKAMPRSV